MHSNETGKATAAKTTGLNQLAKGYARMDLRDIIELYRLQTVIKAKEMKNSHQLIKFITTWITSIYK